MKPIKSSGRGGGSGVGMTGLPYPLVTGGTQPITLLGARGNVLISFEIRRKQMNFQIG